MVDFYVKQVYSKEWGEAGGAVYNHLYFMEDKLPSGLILFHYSPTPSHHPIYCINNLSIPHTVLLRTAKLQCSFLERFQLSPLMIHSLIFHFLLYIELLIVRLLTPYCSPVGRRMVYFLFHSEIKMLHSVIINMLAYSKARHSHYGKN